MNDVKLTGEWGFKGMMMAALEEEGSVFAQDGYVKEEVFKESVECWNAFELSKEGKDTVTAAMASGTALNPKVEKG